MTTSLPLKVLIAEDDFLAREKIKELVETAGYVVAGEATDGQEAVDLAQVLKPDVILMDVQMPRLTGLEAAQQIQTLCPAPVVVLTAYQNPELITQASAAGVGAYLIKPPTAREIARTITIAVARFTDMMELRRLNAQLEAEILERNRLEAQLMASLDEKKLLLQEIHHRVKNNLMVVSSLLSLQADTIEDGPAKAAFKESQNRVQSMARIHEQFYKSRNLAQIDMNNYINSLSSSLRQSYGAYRVALRVEVANVSLGIDAAIPCGLIINELVSNAFKYAFPNGSTGEVWITLKPNSDQSLHLVVSDNGVGLPPHFNLEDSHTLGLELVKLLTYQLDGSFEVCQPPDKPGVAFNVTFRP